MIRIVRPNPEPHGVASQRTVGIKLALAAYDGSSTNRINALKRALTKYDGGKDALYRAQHRKCAYCERNVGQSSSPVEHFRPKKEAWRHIRGDGASVVDEDRYWWLTWTWENMLFSCVTCNDAGHKANFFPLEVGTAPLPMPTWTPGATSLGSGTFSVTAESPMLIDPARVDPLQHIEWRPNNPLQPQRLWKWDPNPLTDVGRVTIKTLRLNELTDDVSDHIRNNLLDRTAHICADLGRGNVKLAASDWLQLCRDVASSSSVYAAASWCALHLLVSDALRQQGSLPLCPRP